jgi:hypothetical protein
MALFCGQLKRSHGLCGDNGFGIFHGSVKGLFWNQGPPGRPNQTMPGGIMVCIR